MLQNPSAAFLQFLWRTLHKLYFAGFELQARQNWDGIPSPVHFLTSKPVFGINMRDYKLLCDSSAAALTSPLQTIRDVRNKR